MPNFKKKIRLVSLIEGDITLLTAQANAIFAYIDEQEHIEGATIGQTYRTYESRMTGKQKSFYNHVFFTNSITLAFGSHCPKGEIDKTMAELEALVKKVTVEETEQDD